MNGKENDPIIDPVEFARSKGDGFDPNETSEMDAVLPPVASISDDNSRTETEIELGLKFEKIGAEYLDKADMKKRNDELKERRK